MSSLQMLLKQDIHIILLHNFKLDRNTVKQREILYKYEEVGPLLSILHIKG